MNQQTPIEEPTVSISKRICLISQALTLARQGFRVFPVHCPHFRDGVLTGCSCGKPDCTDVGKHPRIKGWPELATTDEDQIREWWYQWPDANIGIATGGPFIVLDLDTPTAGAGLDLPPTRTVKTGRGLHLYYALPEGVQLRNGALCYAIDTRGDGGFVLGPGSLHRSGVRYELVPDHANICADLPQAILATLQRREREKAARVSTTAVTEDLEPAPPLDEIPIDDEFKDLIRDGGSGDRSLDLSRAYRALSKAKMTPKLTRGQIATICWDEAHAISEKPHEKGIAWLLRDIDRVLDLEERKCHFTMADFKKLLNPTTISIEELR